MVGDTVSLLQTRQRHEALKALGYYKGDAGAPWGTASTEALRAAQTALGIGVDGKWGPETEDAVQRALAAQTGCSADECSPKGSQISPAGESSDPLRGIGRLGWWIIGGTAIVGVTVGVALAVRERS
nr:peptidoglycan-binding domain-containing protein [Nannocystis pusilla]